MKQRFALTVDSRLEHLSEIADFIQQAATECGLPQKQIDDVQMAVDEACSNIIQHAYHGQEDGTIDIVCEQQGKEFVVTIQDFGDKFDPKRVQKPNTRDPLGRRNIGGLGLFFMHRLMDKIEFDFSSTRGNRLTMVKKIKK